MTDSGDNSTSGSTGWNTYVLRQFLNVDKLQKEVLFASICDPKSFDFLSKKNINDECEIALGMNYDELSKSCPERMEVN